jgi:hypothetical protein
MKPFELSPAASGRERVRFVETGFYSPHSLARKLRGEYDPRSKNFLHACLQSDPVPDKGNGHINWRVVCGMGLSLAVSASFWVAIAVVAGRILK